MVYKSLPLRSGSAAPFFPIVNEGRRVISIKVFLSSLMMFSRNQNTEYSIQNPETHPNQPAQQLRPFWKSVGVSQLCKKQQLN